LPTSSRATVIRLEGVTKRYRAGRSRTIVDLVAAGVDRVRGRDADVYSAARGRISAVVSALDDVSFDVEQGSGLGIIGSNGAGKTTLLKLISRVTWPTRGRVRVAGRVVSLIELGAGFHPELTGRENVYLGAGLFGLTKREIDRQFDAIVDFAGVAPLIDTPMKRFSSGLYARLGFSVAIHSDPDIVLVDEVLAVGDAAFRRRAIDSLRRLIGDGKTVLFISHDLWNVRRLCDRVIWMEQGRIRADGPTAGIADRYVDDVNVRALERRDEPLLAARSGTGEIRYTRIEAGGEAGGALVAEGGCLSVRAEYRTDAPVASPIFQVAIVDVDSGLVVAAATSSATDGPPAADGIGTIECTFPSLPLRPRQYVLRLAITDVHQIVSYDLVSAGPRFVVGAVAAGRLAGDEGEGLVSIDYRFAHHAGALA
jgi:ABC-type polysaccharide/polyol phosphate transport system ATPase subunit